MRQQVEALLKDYDAPLSSLATIDAGAGNSDPALPSRVGDFRILGRLGRGGMGVVFRAEQDRPRRQVALKLLLPTELEVDARKRLALEVEVLGRLHHPGIAQIFDAGYDSSPLGEQPYFAMELIEGHPLTVHCEATDASIRERCELIAKVCDGVQHAHDRGVVHRDLKPANVLVATIEGQEPQPKILDFGIARCLDFAQDSGTQTFGTLTTQSGLLIGTLAYMSPEQFLLGQADARSDVYSAGVMLYELLTRTLPYDLAGKSMTEVHQLFADAAPRPIRRPEQLPADLRTIVARALSKDPAERYATAAALRDDLGRFLADQPIHARPLTVRYQLRKFARRHKAIVFGLVATAAALVVGTLVSIAFRLEAQRAQADAQREAIRSQRSEYVAQLSTAATSMQLDPGGAASALDLVRESAGLEWHVLDCRNRVAVPVGAQPDNTETRGDMERLVDNRVLRLEIADDHANLRDVATEEVLLRVPGAFLGWHQGDRIARDGSKILLVDRSSPPRARIFNVADGSVRGELTWSRIPRPRDFDVTMSHDWEFASLWLGEVERRHVRLDTLEAFEFQAPGRPTADPLLPGIWYARKLLRWSDGGEILSVQGPGSTDHSMEAFPSPDGRYVVMRGNNHRNLDVIDRKSGKLVQLLPGHSSLPRSVAWSHDGTMLASCDWTSIRLWDLRTWQCTRTFVSTAQDLAFSKNDRELVGFGDPFDPAVRFPTHAEANRTLYGQSGYVLSGALDPTGRILASGDTSGQLRLWDLDTGSCIGVLQLGRQIEEIQFADDGKSLRCQQLSRPGTRVSLLEPAHSITGDEWWPQRSTRWRRRIESNGIAWAIDRRWNFESGLVDQIEILRYAGGGSETRFTIALENPGVATHRAAADRRKVAREVLESRKIPPFCMHPDQTQLCVGLDDGAIAVVDLATKQLLAHALRHQGPVLTVTYTPDGKRLLSGGLDGTLRIWDTESWNSCTPSRRTPARSSASWSIPRESGSSPCPRTAQSRSGTPSAAPYECVGSKHNKPRATPQWPRSISGGGSTTATWPLSHAPSIRPSMRVRQNGHTCWSATSSASAKFGSGRGPPGAEPCSLVILLPRPPSAKLRVHGPASAMARRPCHAGSRRTRP